RQSVWCRTDCPPARGGSPVSRHHTDDTGGGETRTPGRRGCRHTTGRGPAAACCRNGRAGIGRKRHRSVFSTALQGHDACLRITEDAPDGGRGAETGEPVRVRQAHDFSHPEIMPGFHAPEKKKNHGKMAARTSFFARSYPHTWEKSPNKFKVSRFRRLFSSINPWSVTLVLVKSKARSLVSVLT